MSGTLPAIYIAQQRPECIEMLKAQSFAYSQAKTARNTRLAWVNVVAIATVAVTAAVDSTTTKTTVAVAGAVVGLIIDFYARLRLSARVNVAVAIQEKFDTTIYRLPWNTHIGLANPVPAEVAALASRYKGDRFTKPWYPDTGTVHRPLDILLCQQSNLAWAKPTHGRWANVLLGGTALVLAVPLLAWATGILTGSQYATYGLLPWMPLVGWLILEATDHLTTRSEKSHALQDLLDQWNTALTSPIDEGECRAIQNEIVNSRKRHAVIPDWFDKRDRKKNEQAMAAAATAMRAEAARHGKA